MRIAIVALTAWGLLMIVPDLSRVVRPLASAGFAADNDGRIYDVRGPFAREQDSPAWKAGLRVGDQIDFAAMQCGPPRPRGCTNLLSVLGGMGGAQLVRRGRVLSVTVLPASGGPARVVHVTAQPNPASWVSRFILLLNELAGIAVVLGAAWLAWTQPSAMTLGFWVYALWFNPGQDFVYFLVLQERPLLLMAQEVLASLAHGAACAGLLLFALRVPNDQSEKKWWFVMRILPAVALAIASMQLISYTNIFGYPTENVSRATFLADYAVDVLALWILVRRRHGHPPQEYQRMRWVIWGCMIGLPAFILSAVLQSTSLWYTLTGSATIPLGVISVLLLTYGILGWFVLEAMRRPRVVNVSIPLRRVTVFGLLISIPLVFADRATDWLRDTLALPDWSWILVAALLFYLTSRVHDLSVEVADRAFNRTFRRQMVRLRQVGREILAADTVGAVERLLIEAPVAHLHLASAAVFRREDSGYRRFVCTVGWPAGTAYALDPRDGAMRGLDTEDPVQINPGDAARLGFPTGLAAPTVVVAVEDQIRRFALALYGPHDSGADLAADERAALVLLAGDAALAYRRAETLELRREVADLQHRLASAHETDRASPEAVPCGSNSNGPA